MGPAMGHRNVPLHIMQPSGMVCYRTSQCTPQGPQVSKQIFGVAIFDVNLNNEGSPTTYLQPNLYNLMPRRWELPCTVHARCGTFLMLPEVVRVEEVLSKPLRQESREASGWWSWAGHVCHGGVHSLTTILPQMGHKAVHRPTYKNIARCARGACNPSRWASARSAHHWGERRPKAAKE